MADVHACIYGGCLVIGDFAKMEDHAVREHGAEPSKLLACNFESEAKGTCEKTFKTLETRRSHRKRAHGVG